MDKESLLQKNDLKRTSARLKVLHFFEESDHALSQPDLEQQLGEEIDRVTLYRILSIFEEKGIVHKVIDPNGTGKYALCRDCSAHHHHDEHLHFNCSVCHNTYCLENIHVPHIQLPEGFAASDIVLSASGICAKCRQPAEHTAAGHLAGK
ncbi:MAG: transcriptional repressor [Mucilaginibacter polytrichastri]|nr:transcriptional repressor [Mucilaginibacter polytrichastri]